MSNCSSDVGCSATAETLNKNCFCITLDPERLDKILRVDAIAQDIVVAHPHFFSKTAVFISPSQLQQMSDIVRAVTRVAGLPTYERDALLRMPALTSFNPGTSGVFMGYDFHLDDQGPHIIEINTNAGGAFLNAALAGAQTECCRAAGVDMRFVQAQLEQEIMGMFLREWQLQRGTKPLACIAIVDENPLQQFLYPEFKMAQRLFEQNGIHSVITDPGELEFNDGKLMYKGTMIDMVYNRLTDFSLLGESLSQLRQAYEADSVVLTPNPRHYALYADKRNLAILSNTEHLEKLGANDKDIELLREAIPQTQAVSADNATRLWAERKQLFFKPACGFGSRAVYRGDKLTKRVWNEILNSDYIAQRIVLPSERGILVDGAQAALKMDIRAYVYAGKIQLLAARLYQGQTTNFRTQGGGFAPVFIAQ